MKQKTMKFAITIAIIFGALAGLIYFIFAPQAIEIEAAKVRIRLFKVTLRADGILRSKERYTVPAFADGDIKRVTLKVGDSIKKDDLITELFWDIKYEPLRAPVSGVISKVHRESSGPIRRGDPIVEIIDPTQLEVVAELLTTDAVRLPQGAIAWIDDWSGGPPIRAKVSRISKAGFTKQSALGVEEERTEVTANLVDAPPQVLDRLGSSFHVDVTFEISQSNNALTIPVGALFRDGSTWAVFVAENGRARKRTVNVLAIGSEDASLLSGVTEGEIVLVYPGDLIKDNTPVHLRLLP
jgi:HlyD family secretion protein